jgi:hypothetical protein
VECAHLGRMRRGVHYGLSGRTLLLMLHSALNYLAQIVTALRCQLLAYLVNLFNDRVLPHIMFPTIQLVCKCAVLYSQGLYTRVPSEHTSLRWQCVCSSR